MSALLTAHAGADACPRPLTYMTPSCARDCSRETVHVRYHTKTSPADPDHDSPSPRTDTPERRRLQKSMEGQDAFSGALLNEQGTTLITCPCGAAHRICSHEHPNPVPNADATDLHQTPPASPGLEPRQCSHRLVNDSSQIASIWCQHAHSMILAPNALVSLPMANRLQTFAFNPLPRQ